MTLSSWQHGSSSGAASCPAADGPASCAAAASAMSSSSLDSSGALAAATLSSELLIFVIALACCAIRRLKFEIVLLGPALGAVPQKSSSNELPTAAILSMVTLRDRWLTNYNPLPLVGNLKMYGCPEVWNRKGGTSRGTRGRGTEAEGWPEGFSYGYVGIHLSLELETEIQRGVHTARTCARPS